MATPVSLTAKLRRYLVPPEELQFAEYVFRFEAFNPLKKGTKRSGHKWFSISDKEALWVIINALANTCGGVIDIRTVSGDPVQDLDLDELQKTLSTHPNQPYKDCLTVHNEAIGSFLVVHKSNVFITAKSNMYTRGLAETIEVLTFEQLSAILSQAKEDQSVTSCLSAQTLIYQGICTLAEVKNVEFKHFNCTSVKTLIERITDPRCAKTLFAMPNLLNGGDFIVGVDEDKSLGKCVFLGVELDEADKKYILEKLSIFMQIDAEGFPRVWGELLHTEIKEGVHWFLKFIPLSITPHTCDGPPCCICPSKGERCLIHLRFPHIPGGVLLRKPEAFVLKEDGSVEELKFIEWSKIHQKTFSGVSTSNYAAPGSAFTSPTATTSNLKSSSGKQENTLGICEDNATVSVSGANTGNSAESGSDATSPTATTSSLKFPLQKPEYKTRICEDNVTVRFSAHSSHKKNVTYDSQLPVVKHPEKYDLFRMSKPINYTPPKSEIESVLSDKSALQEIDTAVNNKEAFGVAADSLFTCIKHSVSMKRPPHHLMDVLVVNKLRSIILFVICSTLGSSIDHYAQRAYTMSLGRILKMQMVVKSKIGNIAVPCHILSLTGQEFKSDCSELTWFPLTHSIPQLCKCLVNVLTNIQTHFSDTIRKDVDIELSEEQLHILQSVTRNRFNFIEGPPGCGKTVLAMSICKKLGKDTSVYISKSSQLTNFVSQKGLVNAVCVTTDSSLLTMLGTITEDLKHIVIDDAQNLSCTEDVIKQVLDYCQNNKKTLYVFQDSKYQSFRQVSTQFVHVYYKYHTTSMYDGATCDTMKVIRRNSQAVASYITALIPDVSSSNPVQCESLVQGDDVIVKHIQNLHARHNNGLVAHVRSILSNQNLSPQQKHYTVCDVAILLDNTDESALNNDIMMFRRLFMVEWRESCVQNANQFPQEGIVIDSLDNVCGLEFRVVIFVMPEVHSNDAVRSISNPKYKIAIASRGIDRVDFVQESNLEIKQLEGLKFDNISTDLLKTEDYRDERIRSYIQREVHWETIGEHLKEALKIESRNERKFRWPWSKKERRQTNEGPEKLQKAPSRYHADYGVLDTDSVDFVRSNSESDSEDSVLDIRKSQSLSEVPNNLKIPDWSFLEGDSGDDGDDDDANDAGADHDDADDEEEEEEEGDH